MEPPEQKLEQLFEKGHALLERFSIRWRAHTNRRTILFAVVVGAIAIFSYLYLIRPPDAFPVDHLVSVPAGIPLSSIGTILEEGKVVRSGLTLNLLVTVMGNERDVHAGDYLFKEPQDVFSIARAISIGAYGLEPIRIRIPEGATAKEMAVIFDKRLERFDETLFLAKAESEEGYLFPDTYFFLPNATEDLVHETMRQNFDARVATIAPEIASSTHPLGEIVIMASILEREARNSNDRRMIAGVLWNRLKRGMLLQVDAAFLYTIGKGTFDLTLEDLRSDSPYNTYKYKGLPPTAIGSPSLDSLRAAANPINNNYLFYLADNSFVTHYSKTYAEHLRLKRLYLGN